MNLHKHPLPNGLKFEISGTFTFADHKTFKVVLESVEGQDINQIELDFSKVTFIDSAALGMLLLLRDHCQNAHIPIAILGAAGQVEKVLKISKFDQLFTMRK